MIITSKEKTVAAQSCPPSLIYTTKLGIRVASTVYGLCAAVSGHISKGLAEAQQ